jgi:hypothetical protein
LQCSIISPILKEGGGETKSTSINSLSLSKLPCYS